MTGQARFSPDTHWVVYTSNETGTKEVYVQPFPISSGGKWPVSNGGGNQPRWRRDGKELFYFAPDSSLMAVDVSTTGGDLKLGVPKALFKASILGGTGGGPVSSWRWDSPDGQALSHQHSARRGGGTPVTILLNWQAVLKK